MKKENLKKKRWYSYSMSLSIWSGLHSLPQRVPRVTSDSLDLGTRSVTIILPLTVIFSLTLRKYLMDGNGLYNISY